MSENPPEPMPEDLSQPMPEDLPQQMIAHYRVQGKLGQGGMGEVYLAEDTRLGRKAAIKLLPSDFAADEERRRRFVQEARAASALNHPHVCVIYEVGESAHGVPFIAMEFVEGPTLDALIKDGPLSVEQIVDLGLQVVDALAAAHDVGIVHRDIKPSNINVSGRGRVKILDFGLAKRILQPDPGEFQQTADYHQTQTGQVMGTPSYMSPEQLLGRGIDHRTDIFSFGVVLYQLATGRLPFVGSSLGDVANKILHSQPEAMARFNYDLDPELERITLKCLQKDAERRYQSAGELLVDLRNLKHAIDNPTGDAARMRQATITHAGPAPWASGPEMSLDELTGSDIFISCAQLDDQPLTAGREGWVTQFQRNLKVRLEQLSGEPVRVVNRPMPPGATTADEELFRQLPQVKTMVSVLSPPFAKSEGCRRGVEEFWRANEETGRFRVEDKPRLFKVLKTPLNVQELPPRLADLFQQLMGFEFFERDAETNRFREFDEAFGEEAKQRYYEKIYDLAYEIAEVLKYQETRPISESGARTGKTIYLAETTSDLLSERDRLRRELLEQGFGVLPDRPLPLVAGDLEAAIQSYLEQCHLAIHLVGERYGLVPEDSEQSVVALQNHFAAQRSKTDGLERFIWMPRNTVARDQRQADFIRRLVEDPQAHCGAEVIEDTLENLKEVLDERRRREEHAEQAKAAVPSESGAVARLYLICQQEDEAAIEPIEDFFYEQSIEVSLPEFEQDEAAACQVHQRNLQDCDAALIYYGSAGKSWVDIKLRELIKALGYRDGRPLEQQAVYIAPPIDRRKERFKTLSAAVIRQEGEGFDSTSLMSFCSDIKTRKQKASSA